MSQAERIARRNAKLALIYHAAEFGLAAVGIGWAIFQMVQITKKPLTECKRPER